MKKSVILLLCLVFACSFVSAHEHQVFKIGGEQYEVTIGSVNEPVFVDDKSGVELSIAKIETHEMEEIDDHAAASGDHHEATTPVTGLESTLKVEVSAGGKQKVFDLSPVWGEAGSYKAPFYPTVATTYTYRVFGTIDNVPVDLSFSCSPAGHTAAAEDNTVVQISEGVSRISKSGAFGCPRPRSDALFPEQTLTSYELSIKSSAQEAKLASLEAKGGQSAVVYAALAIGIVALIASLRALKKGKGSI